VALAVNESVVFLLMASSELKPLHLLVMTGDDSATCGLLKEGSGSEAFLPQYDTLVQS
jgi:hypothetical protein